MIADTPVLLLDNGDLGPVGNLLEELGADFERLPGSSARMPVKHPGVLLICSEPLVRSLRLQRSVTASVPRATWIVFGANGSIQQKASLRSAGFDFLVREPVHPAALRVLVQRALFRGPESRRAPRVACGQPITFKTGFWRQKGMLIDLSARGCRLLVDKSVKEKCEISIQIPKTLASGRALDLVGHVVRVAPAGLECGHDGQMIVGVRFAPIEGDIRTRFRAVLSERVLGPAVLPAKLALKTRVSRPAPRPSDSPQRPTRVHKRARYQKKLTAMEGDESYVVMCRDLSIGGMRIEPIEGLEIGSRIDLAIQLSPRDEQFLVETSIVRMDRSRVSGAPARGPREAPRDRGAPGRLAKPGHDPRPASAGKAPAQSLNPAATRG